ncbi:hypothetical protein MTR67_046230 [Solanum verrucosum]|uniref:Reverse transcriptase zinc-binding domain-containing protein n=1 Tax=Solanum verrucosum TaxID=315347 RepID=A0AAF0UVI3_SOLVR|nr:hypothetical protein MTR67_046230 [Solanum verrucosum]
MSRYWRRNNSQVNTEVRTWKLIWKVKIPLKVACFDWLVVRQARLTHEVLQGRGFLDLLKVYSCNREAEVDNHLFLHCKAATNLWNMFLYILGVSWVMPKSTKELLNCWKGIGSRGASEDWWRSIPACVWWTLWKERNSRFFEGKGIKSQKIRIQCVSLLYFWCKQDMVGDTVHKVDFIGNL